MPLSSQPVQQPMSTSRPAAKKVSLADIARRAGVSTNTVSRVVRGDPEVSEKTRARIAKLVEELGYVPNYAARALAAKRTNVLQVVLAAPMFHGHGRVLLSILNASSQAGYHVSLSYAYGPDGQLRNDFAPFDVDGVIILGGQDPTIDVAIEAGKRFPTVLVLTSEKGLDGISTVAVDNVRGARLATEHLLAQGLTDVVHISGPVGWSDAQMRRIGYEQACASYDIEPVVLEPDSWDSRDGYDTAPVVIPPDGWAGVPGTASCPAAGRLPQGIQTANDQLALGAMRYIYERGGVVPRDVRVVGFDDIDGADSYAPPLTTIHQPFDRLGRTAVRLVRSLMGGGPSQDIVLDPELVIRASSHL